MPTKHWRGAAAKVAQQTTITWSAYTMGVTYTVTINGKDMSYTAAASTVSDVVAGLIAVMDSAAEPEFSEFSKVESSGLRLTATIAGVPFVVTASSDGAPTATVTHNRAATGPEFFDNADNWDEGAIPVAGDDIVFASSSTSVKYALEQTAVNYGDVTIDSTFSGSIGLPPDNALGYREYRPRFLKLGDGTSGYSLTVGQGTGRQSTRLQIDANAGDVLASVYATGSAQGEESPFILRNPGALSELDVYGGSVTVDATTTGTLAALRITPAGGTQGSRVIAGVNVACGVITLAGGSLEVRGSATSIDATGGGQATFTLAATCPTVKVGDGASVVWQSTAGITTQLTVYSRGEVIFSRSAEPKTVAAAAIYTGGKIDDALGVVTWTTGINLNGARLSEVNIDLGRSRTITP